MTNYEASMMFRTLARILENQHKIMKHFGVYDDGKNMLENVSLENKMLRIALTNKYGEHLERDPNDTDCDTMGLE